MSSEHKAIADTDDDATTQPEVAVDDNQASNDNDADEEVPASEPEADDAEEQPAAVTTVVDASTTATADATMEEAAAEPVKKAKKANKKAAVAETRAAYEAKRHKRGQKLRFNELLRKCVSKGAVKDLALRSGMLTTMKETKEFIRRLYASLTTTLMVAALYHTHGAKRCTIQLEDVRRAYQSQTGWALYAHDMNSKSDFAKCRLLSQKTLNARAADKRLKKAASVQSGPAPDAVVNEASAE